GELGLPPRPETQGAPGVHPPLQAGAGRHLLVLAPDGLLALLDGQETPRRARLAGARPEPLVELLSPQVDRLAEALSAEDTFGGPALPELVDAIGQPHQLLDLRLRVRLRERLAPGPKTLRVLGPQIAHHLVVRVGGHAPVGDQKMVC